MGRAEERARLERLRYCVQQANGNVLEAVRKFTGEATNETCRRLKLNPSTVRGCLNKTYGRRYESTRRTLELGLGLPTYSLDHILDNNHAS